MYINLSKDMDNENVIWDGDLGGQFGVVFSEVLRIRKYLVFF